MGEQSVKLGGNGLEVREVESIGASRKAVERYRLSSLTVWSEVNIACKRKSRHLI